MTAGGGGRWKTSSRAAEWKVKEQRGRAGGNEIPHLLFLLWGRARAAADKYNDAVSRDKAPRGSIENVSARAV